MVGQRISAPVCMSSHRYVCVFMYVLQGLSFCFAAGGEVIGKRSRVFTSGYCRGFAPPAVKHGATVWQIKCDFMHIFKLRPKTDT